jgi:hypothetical protein
MNPSSSAKFLLPILLGLSSGKAHATEGIAQFESQIRPILTEYCYECHSADKKQKGNLLLDTKDGLLKGGETGPAILPGDPSKSLLIQAVRHVDKDLAMPPKKKLSDEQIAALESWVKAGAPDPRSGAVSISKIDQHLENAKSHWAFQPIVDPKPSSLDALLGLHGTPRSDKRILIRRAYLDLLGVPPTYEDVSAFLADTSSDAFDRVLEKLLADSRYGERWGRHWLDVARYADTGGTNGGGDDTYPYAWTYRDYVIKAFNEDMPYDRFLQEQIAADRMEVPKDKTSLAALGFLTMGWRKTDNSIDDDTWDNAIDTIGRGVLGLSLSCARCHDHKLEPITTKDYYGLFSILKSSSEPKDIPALPAAHSPEAMEFAKKNIELRSEYAALSNKAFAEANLGARGHVGDYFRLAHESEWQNRFKNQKVDAMCNKAGLLVEIQGYVVAKGKDWMQRHPEVFAPLWEAVTQTKVEPAPELHPLIARAFETPAESLEEIANRYNTVFGEVAAAWHKLAEPELKKDVSLTEEEIHLFITSNFPFQDALQPLLLRRVEALEESITLPDPQQESLRKLLIAKDSPFKFARDQVRRTRIIPEKDPSYKPVGALWTLINEHPGSPPRPMLLEDNPKPYDGFVYIRGNPESRGQAAPRQFLTVLRAVSPNPFPKATSGRLELAKALSSKENPLTARVMVNRVWGWHFGKPIVSSPSDFGFQGDKPSNPALLDHLAAWFMEHQWSFKQLHRYIMQSDAYQSAHFSFRPLEFESFRDSVLSVSGRLDPAPFGKPRKGDTDVRRTVYGFVDRKFLPALYRNFDFPSPSFSAPQRSHSALAPRALILLNSPLLAESAKALAASIEPQGEEPSAKVTMLYRRVLQRDPVPQEIQSALRYLAAYPKENEVHPESLAWQYGYGEFEEESGKVKHFSSITQFDSGTSAIKGKAPMADGKMGGVMLNRMGGEAAPSQRMGSIRRWVAPVSGSVDVNAELTHSDPKTEGVLARLISSRVGVLGEWKASKGSVCTDLHKVTVEKGETLDFLVCSLNEKEPGTYVWSPCIAAPGMPVPGMPGMVQRWDARTDFADPKVRIKPLSAFEELCQTLLLSPEFAVLE